MAPLGIEPVKSDMDLVLERVSSITLADLDEMRSQVKKTERRIDAKYGSYEELAILFLRTCTKENIRHLLTLLRKITKIAGVRGLCGRTLVHIAAKENPDIIPSLIRLGCEVDTRDLVFSNTPLHLACVYGHMKSMFYLIQYGAGINLHNHTRETPLDIYLSLCRCNMGDLVFSNTPLHLACVYGHLKSMFYLIQYGAGINLHNHTRETPLDIYLSLCRCNMGQRIEKRRMLISHTLARMGFKMTPRQAGKRRHTFRNKIFHNFHNTKTCNSIFSLQHICRLKVRELLPPESLQGSIESLGVSKIIHDFLLYRPVVLDRHVVCPHISEELIEEMPNEEWE